MALVVPIRSPSYCNAYAAICGGVYIGETNAYALLAGVLIATPILADGSFSRDLDADWGEVEDDTERGDEIRVAQRFFGFLPG